MSNLFGRAPGVSGANDIPPPASDDDKNVAPQVAVERIADFVKEDPQALYTFDSRVNRDILTDPSTELCRRRRDGGVSCVKVAVESKALFKTMQSLGFYCALPAMPTETHMECRLVPRSS